MKPKIKRLLIAIGSLLLGTNAFAHDFEVDGIYYTREAWYSNNVCVTYRGSYPSSYSDEYSGNVTIPETVTYSGKTYSVTSIGNDVFYGCSGLTSVTIPNSVTKIGSAFRWCSGLTSVTIGNSVTRIGDYAFCGCSGLTSVTIPNSVTEIGYAAFSRCTGLTSVTIPNSVTKIDDYVFSQCSGLTSVTIPNSVTSIGKSAFAYCSGLTSVTIPNSVISIASFAFCGCTGLTELIIADGTRFLALGVNQELSTQQLAEGLFYDCPLVKLYLGRNLAYETDFANGYSPFFNKTKLKEVTIGNYVTSIGYYAFYKCSGLTKLYSKAIVPPTCYNSVFEGVDKWNCVLYVPSASIVRYKAASKWKDFYNIKDIESGVEEVLVDGEDYSYAPIEIYNLSGLKVGDSTENLAPGVYIKRQGRKVEKIAVQ